MKRKRKSVYCYLDEIGLSVSVGEMPIRARTGEGLFFTQWDRLKHSICAGHLHRLLMCLAD